SGTAARPRLAVYRSNRHIYVQLIDDVSSRTVASASDRELGGGGTKGDKKVVAKAVGALIADRAKQAGVQGAVFDRGGRLYHGRIAALAEGAREGGLAI
ncbi:MAG: 50S ribosomal protein L18, partial [Actinomycetota bacterium]